MLLLKPLCLFALNVSALTFSPRDNALLNCLQTIDSDLKDCTSKCKAYTGDALGAVALQQCSTKVNNDIKSCNSSANNTAAFTSAESQQVIDYINNTIIPDLKAYLACIDSKKVSRGDVCKNLDDLVVSFIAKASSDKKSAAQASRSRIQQACSTSSST